MRKIKFRGWYSGADGEIMLAPQDLSQSRNYWEWLGVNDVVLMQFTGLKDKNGVEIYEGDIVQALTSTAETSGFSQHLENYTVKFCNGGFTSCYFSDGQVIGNIYENPELITTEKAPAAIL